MALPILVCLLSYSCYSDCNTVSHFYDYSIIVHLQSSACKFAHIFFLCMYICIMYLRLTYVPCWCAFVCIKMHGSGHENTRSCLPALHTWFEPAHPVSAGTVFSKISSQCRAFIKNSCRKIKMQKRAIMKL